jgi:DNA-directed RNA polymerase subunit RPC12/RpoP
MEEAFVIVAVFQYSQDAQVLRGKLAAEGVPAFLEDEFTVDVDPFVSNAIGGVKLKVASHHKEYARMLIAQSHPEVLTHELTCPNCQSNILKLDLSLSNLIKQLFPFSDKRSYTCEQCNLQFHSSKL